MNGSIRDLSGASLDAERLRNARGLLALRAALTLAFLGVTVAAMSIDVQGARARLPIVAAYCALSFGLYAIGWRYLHFLRHSWVAIAVLDVPAVYAFQRAAMRQVPEHALLIAAMTVAIYLLLVMAVQLSISRSYLVLTAVTSYALLVTLFAAVPGASRTVWVDALLLVAAATAAARRAELRGLPAAVVEAEAVFHTLRNGVQRSRELVAGLTRFARRDEGEPCREVDVGRLLDSAVDLLRYELDSRIEVVRRYCLDGRLRCYPGALTQVFVNLLTNAAQAIDGKGNITLTTARDAGALTVSVEDSGTGIAPDAVNKIFEPFFTTREVGRGTGLGLAIAHAIVERHRGSIRVEPRAPQGTRFEREKSI